MRAVVAVLAGALMVAVVLADQNEKKQPVVNVYTETPVEFGVKNRLICHCSGFHPPRISMRLMKDGAEMPSSAETDLSFDRDWTYYKTKHIEFTPKEGEEYTCVVTHDQGTPKTHRLEIF